MNKGPSIDSKAWVFDLDGLLVETQGKVGRNIFAQMAIEKELGESQDQEGLKKLLHGRAPFGAFLELTGRVSAAIQLVMDFQERYLAAIQQPETVQVIEDGRALLQHVLSKTDQVAIFTGSSRQEYEIKSKVLPELSQVPLVITRSDLGIGRGKPNSDGLHCIADQWHVGINELMVVEDSFVGMQTILNADARGIVRPSSENEVVAMQKLLSEHQGHQVALISDLRQVIHNVK